TLGVQNVSVTVGGVASNTVPFTVQAAGPPTPTLTGINPPSGTQGSNSVAVTLTGTNFAAPANITISGGTGITVSNVSVVSATSITAIFAIAANATLGVQNVSVTVGGVASNTVSFTVQAAAPPSPTLTGISPQSGTQGNNSIGVTLSGTNFATPASI